MIEIWEFSGNQISMKNVEPQDSEGNLYQNFGYKIFFFKSSKHVTL